MEKLRYLCNMVIPLVYDNTLSYYELLCKVVEKLNKLVENNNTQNEEIQEIKNAIAQLNKWISEFDTNFIEQCVDNYIKTAVFFGLSEEGYFIASIPDKWCNIEFRTTEYDYHTPLNETYGHLVMLY